MDDMPGYMRYCLNTGKLVFLAILVSGGIVLQVLACALYNNWWPMLSGASTLGGIAIPSILKHAGVIGWAAFAMELSSFFYVLPVFPPCLSKFSWFLTRDRVSSFGFPLL
ncbi:hypothetical protein RYX36_003410 [Vicia faba]